MCSLSWCGDGQVLSASTKVLTGRTRVLRHVEMGAELRQEFIDDPLLDCCSIWYGDVYKG
jgi:hypothetical protein